MEGMIEMGSNRKSILALLVAAVVAASALPCCGEEKAAKKQEKSKEEKKQDIENKEDIWTEEEPRRGWRRLELTEEETARVMKGLKERDPKAAKELAKLRKKDPEKFKAELARVAREEVGKIMRERFEAWRSRRRAEFLEWLKKNYRREAEELDRLKDTNPDLWAKQYDLISEKYRTIFEASSRNPELAEVLKEDLQLKTRRGELLRKLRTERDEKKKKQLAAQLAEVVARRFDLIVRRKEIEYERLLKRLEELRKRICESRDQIREWKKTKFKEENVKKRLEDLTEGIPRFKWD